ncbi:MAG: IS66 family transposase [Rhodospirillales bacterium]
MRQRLPAAAQTPQAVYDRIELPPIRPDVTRVHLFGGRCTCCGKRAVAAAPAGLRPGSPFGRSIEALVVYLHYVQAIGLERLRLVMRDVFGLSISEGALVNIMARAKPRLEAEGERIAQAVRGARVVHSDETSARVAGRNWWEWVFVTGEAALHLIRPSRGAGVPHEVFGDVRPGVWVSDAYGSQRGHAERWQMCLAHLLRDTQYAIDCGDTVFSQPFKKLLLRAVIIGRRRHSVDDAVRARWRDDLDHRLDRIMAAAPTAMRTASCIAASRASARALFTFVTDLEVPPTNNISERQLRPSVIFRKVTTASARHGGPKPMPPSDPSSAPQNSKKKNVLTAIQHALAANLAPVGG